MLASIIITNFNYGRYLGDAIESALAQSYADVEVIVVDDGSSDDSHEVIARYGDRITLLMKENGGMASTYNAGVAVARGDVIIFLDADDMLLPDAVTEAVRCFEDRSVAKAHWRLDVIDEHGIAREEVVPARELAEGDLRDAIITIGPDAYMSPPTSGNAWRRSFLEKVLPMPEEEFRQHADIYLCTLVPLYGTLRAPGKTLGRYRVHGKNDYACAPTDRKLRRNLEIYALRCEHLARHCAALGITADRAAWVAEETPYGWMNRLNDAIATIEATVPEGSSYILADGGEWADRRGGSEFIGGRRSIPFTENDGCYWGPPADDETGVREIERLRNGGAEFIVFGWPAYWWLDHYQGMAGYLEGSCNRMHASDLVTIYNLEKG